MIVWMSLIAFLGAYFLSFSCHRGLLDYADSLDRSWRLFSGQVPYRDFFCPTTPGTYALQALLWRIGGPSLVMCKLYLATANAFLIGLTVWILKRLNLSWRDQLMVGLIALLWSPYILRPMPWYDTDSMAAAFVFGFFLIAHLVHQKFSLALLAGLWAALAFMFKQNVGMACIACGLVGVGWRFMAAFVSGMALVFVPTALIFWKTGSFSIMMEWIFTRAASAKASNPLMFLVGPVRHLFSSTDRFLWVIFGIYGWGFWKVRQLGRVWKLAIVLAFLLTYAALVSTGGFLYMVNSGLLWVPVAVLLLTVKSRAARSLLCAVVLLQSARHIYMGVKSTPYELKYGRLKGVRFDEIPGRGIDGAMEFLAGIPPTETVWIYPEPQIAYFGTGRQSPSPAMAYSYPAEMRVSDQEAVIQQVRQKNPTKAIYWPAQEGLPKASDGTPEVPLFQKFLKEEFQSIGTNGELHFLERKQDVPG